MDVFPGQKSTVSVAPNPTAARALVKGSPTVTLDYPTDRYVDMPAVAQAIAAMLENVGINVTLVPEPYATGIAKMLQGQMSGLLLTGLVPNVPDPNYPAQVLLTKTSVSRNCVDHRFDSLTAAALAEPNIAAAQPLYDRMDKLAVVNLACFVPLYWAVAYVAMSNDVNGLVLTPLNALYLDKVTKG
jgi:ABC-type transport system substrate-binding protein